MAKLKKHRAERPISSAIDLSLGMFLIVFVGVAVAKQPNPATDRGKRAAVKRVSQYPDSPIAFDNYTGVPVLIREATVKEIGSGEFTLLTGLPTESLSYVSYPNVALLNNTDQRVISLALAIGNRSARRINGVKLGKISIEPHGTLAVKSADFLRSERIVTINKSGKVTERLRPGFDSEKMWLRGRASEMVMIVGTVELEDGTTWLVSPKNDPW